MGKLYNEFIKLIVDGLRKDAKRILEECVNERTYQHQSLNLYDSYGYGIYVNGKLSYRGFLSSMPQADGGKKWYGSVLHGRDEINSFLENEYQPSGVVDLAIAAAMPYAKVLETGGGGIKKKYKVISMSFQKLKEIASDYNAKVSIIK